MWGDITEVFKNKTAVTLVYKICLLRKRKLLIIIIIIIIIDEQRSQKPTSLLVIPKFSAVAFLRGDLLCTDEQL